VLILLEASRVAAAPITLLEVPIGKYPPFVDPLAPLEALLTIQKLSLTIYDYL
jgi:hypothetical protein